MIPNKIKSCIKLCLVVFVLASFQGVSQNIEDEISALEALNKKYMNKPDSLLFYGQKLLELSKTHNILSGQIKAHRNIGFAYNRLQDIQKSLKAYHKALFLSTKYNEPRFKYIIYNDLSLVHRRTTYFDSSLYYSHKILKHYTQAANFSRVHVTQMHIGNTHFQNKQLG